MTHFTRSLLAAVSLAPWLGLAACIEEPVEAPTTTDVPERIYDFSPRRLEDARHAPPPTGTSPKQTLRYVLSRTLPDVAACLSGTNHPAGTVDVTLSIALEPGVPAELEGVLVEAFGDAPLAACIRRALLSADVSSLASPAAAERWTIRAPLLVDANYTGKL